MDETDECNACRAALSRAVVMMLSACLRFNAAEGNASGEAANTLALLAKGSELESQTSVGEGESAYVSGDCVTPNNDLTAVETASCSLLADVAWLKVADAVLACSVQSRFEVRSLLGGARLIECFCVASLAGCTRWRVQRFL